MFRASVSGSRTHSRLSARPEADQFQWISAVEKRGVKFEDLAESGDFDALGAKIANALTKVLKGDDPRRQVIEKACQPCL